MWEIEQLKKWDSEVFINGKWIYARPLSYRKKYLSLWQRLKRAWAVFTCRADVFIWPGGQ
jgi:hypothetical protein